MTSRARAGLTVSGAARVAAAARQATASAARATTSAARTTAVSGGGARGCSAFDGEDDGRGRSCHGVFIAATL